MTEPRDFSEENLPDLTNDTRLAVREVLGVISGVASSVDEDGVTAQPFIGLRVRELYAEDDEPAVLIVLEPRVAHTLAGPLRMAAVSAATMMDPVGAKQRLKAIRRRLVIVCGVFLLIVGLSFAPLLLDKWWVMTAVDSLGALLQCVGVIALAVTLRRWAYSQPNGSKPRDRLTARLRKSRPANGEGQSR